MWVVTDMKWLTGSILGVFFWMGAAGCAWGSPFQNRWLLIDTAARELAVMEGDEPVRVFERIAIGRGGVTRSKVTKDHKTPLGEFYITEIRKSGTFQTFMQLSYPNLSHARAAHDAGAISDEEFWAVEYAGLHGLVPPQNTRLGGQIGIHGVGRGDLRIHRQFDWTQGCIALTNEQIAQLQSLIAVGARVLIR